MPHLFFRHTPLDQIEPNVLTLHIQPDEGIALKLGAKMPGAEMHIRQMQMDFSYADAFGEFPATAYETLLLAFGYDTPHLSVGGTLTLMNSALPQRTIRNS